MGDASAVAAVAAVGGGAAVARAADAAAMPNDPIVGGTVAVSEGGVSAGGVPCGRRLKVPASPFCGVPARFGNDRLICGLLGPSGRAWPANITWIRWICCMRKFSTLLPDPRRHPCCDPSGTWWH